VDATLEQLLTYAAGKDARLASAAAVVLAELAPKDAAAVKALDEALSRGDPVRRGFLIEALARIGTAEAADALSRQIKQGGQGAEDALRAIAHAGAAALKPLTRLVDEVEPALLGKLAEAIGRTGEPAGFIALLETLKEAPQNRAQAIQSGMRAALPALNEKARETLAERIEKLLEGSKFRTHDAACLEALELTGELGAQESYSLLLEFGQKDERPRVRRAALRAAARLNLPVERRARGASKLLALLDDADFGHVVEPALALLKDVALGAEFRKALEKLGQSQIHEVREFAFKALATRGSAKTLSELVAHLEEPDLAVRQEAAAALSQAPGAAEPVAERLLKTKDSDASRLFARVLLPHAKEIPARLVTALSKVYVEYATGSGEGVAATPEAQRAAQERRGALLSVLRACENTALAETALKEAGKLRGNGDPLKALALLKSIQGVPGFGVEQRLELALSGLAAGANDLARSARLNDPNLRTLEELLSGEQLQAATLAKQILKDESIPRRGVLYLAHHFAERMLHERELGRRLLEGLAANPRSEEGKLAKDKLVLEGFIKVSKKEQAGLLEARAEALLSSANIAAKANAKASKKKVKPAKKSSKRKK